MVALDGGVVETTPDLPMERRLERIHGALRRADRLARAEGDGDRGRLLRQERALGDGRRPGQRRRDAGRRRSAASRCFAYTPQAIKMAVCGSGAAGKEQVQRMVGTLLGPARAADARPRRRRPRGGDLPRRRHRPPRGGRRWPPTSAARGAGRRMIAAVRGEVMVRRPDHVVIDAGGVGYRLAVSSETLKAVPGDRARGLPARRADRPRGLARPLRLRLRGGARPLPAADLGQRRRPQGRDRDPLRRHRARPAAGDRRRRRQTLPGGAGDRQADRGADHRRAAREGRRGAGGGGRRSPAREDGDARAPRPRRPGQPRLRAAGGRAAARRHRGRRPEELVAAALRKAAASRSAA